MRPGCVLLALFVLGCADSRRSLFDLLESRQSYGVRAPPFERLLSGAIGFNSYILDAVESFGPGSYQWSGDGVTREIYYQGSLIAQPYGKDLCHCVGATLQVYISAFEAWDKQRGGNSGSLGGLTVSQVKELKQVWFVATDAEQGSQAALSDFHLGAALTSWSDAQPGDLVQFWRNNGSGHSAIFGQWKTSGTQTVGLTYFSCQSGGPGYKTESIGSGSSDIDASRVYLGHPWEPFEGGPPEGGTAIEASAGDATPEPVQDGQPLSVDGQVEEGDESGGCGCTTMSRASPGSSALPLLLILALVLLLARRAF